MSRLTKSDAVVSIDARASWFAFLGQLRYHNTLKALLGSSLLLGFYTLGVAALELEVLHSDFKITNSMHSILGITLGLLLVIRTNTAYERWWEGRKLVGSLVNTSRNLAIKFNAVANPDAATRLRMAALISSYCRAMTEHLRDGVQHHELRDLDDNARTHLQQYEHVPNRLAHYIYHELAEQHRQGHITGEQLMMLDRQAEQFTDIVGGCERIKKTPLPMAYRLHLKLFITVYITTLPFGLMHELRYFTIPAVMIIFYAMVGMEMIGEEIEDPFGTDANDIPMDAIGATIRRNVYEALGVHPNENGVALPYAAAE